MFEDDKDEDDFSFEKLQKMPIYQKAWEILKLCDVITGLILKDEVEFDTDDPIEKEMAIGYAQHIRENSTIIPAKIAGAAGSGLYDLKMENAAIIRKCAREIYVNCTGLRMCKFPDTDYLEILRNEIEEFRVLFAEWVKTFDPWDYIIDRWGLFNPPGVNYDDHDPDDDIPFNPDDFFDDDDFE